MRSRLAGLLLLASCSAQTEDPSVIPPPAPQSRTSEAAMAEVQVTLNELLDRVEVMNARIQRLESQSVQPSEVSSRRGPEASSSATSRVPPPSDRSPQLDPSAMSEQYRNGITLFAKGRLDDSRAAFQQVYDSDPGGELADNALYWIGETYFVVGKFVDAMRYYRRIIVDFADQNKAPDAWLKTGLAQVKQGDLVLARKTFEELIAKYPYSTPASTAKHELKRIKY